MQNKVLYEEKIFSKGIFFILIIVMVLFVFSFIPALKSVDSSDKNLVISVLSIDFLIFLFLAINFAYLKIVFTEEYAQVGYGLFKKKLKWQEVQEVEEDSVNGFYGCGIRFWKYKGYWVWIYNIIGGRRIVLKTNKNKPKGLMFSTNKLEEALSIAMNKLGKK